MFCKIFKRGKGQATGIDYLMNEKDANCNLRIPPAILMRGDINITKRLINHSNFAQKYTSGVLSWAESPSEVDASKLEEIMDGFESMVGTGLENNRLNFLWVKHEDKGRVELHFVVPNVELSTGKRFATYFDRTDRPRFRAWERLTNAVYKFCDPSDPAMKQKLSLPENLPKDKVEATEIIHKHISMLIKYKKIQNREDVIQSLKNSGYKINREGKDYISIQDKEGKKIRLRGAFYQENFSSIEMLEPQPKPKAKSKKEIEELRIELDKQLDKRKKYIKSRYKSAESLIPTSLDAMFSQTLESESDKVNNTLKEVNENDSIRKFNDKNFKTNGAGEQPKIRGIDGAINKLGRTTQLFYRSLQYTIDTITRSIVSFRKANNCNY